MIGRIEQAIIARLKAADAAGVLGYHYRQVDTLPVEIDDELPEFIQQFPSAWAVFGGFRTTDQLRLGPKVRGAFHVVVAAQNLRNESATRLGGTEAEPGSYQMVEDVAGMLYSHDLGLPIGGFELGGCTPLYVRSKDPGRRLSLFALELFTDFQLAPSDYVQHEVGDFKTFHVDWDLPPLGDRAANPIPDDAHADAVSETILETV